MAAPSSPSSSLLDLARSDGAKKAIKYASVSVVGVVELTRMAQDLAASTFTPLPLFAAAGALYLVINWLIALGGAALERSFKWGKA